MKGIMLCGGTGSRLYPLTKLVNKHLLPVYNKPMCMYPLQTLIDAGIHEIMIVSGREHAGQFLQMLGSGKDLGISLSYMVQEKAGGIAEALSLCRHFACGENVAVILGDNIFDDVFDFSDFREGARVYLKEVADPSRFGVAMVNDNRLIGIIEKPSKWNGESGLAVTGLYLYDNRVFDIVSCLRPSRRGEMEITDANNLYIKEGTMDYRFVDGMWTDAGTVESLYKAGTLVRSKKL